MKNFEFILLVSGISVLSACKQLQQVTQGPAINAIDNTGAVPTGTYFIINAAGGALTPLSSGIGENVFLRPFSRSGIQKWQITLHKTAKGAVSYAIGLAGSDNLFLQPYPVKDHTPIIGPRGGNGTSYKIVAAESPKSWYIKSVLFNGDALRTFVFSPNLPTEFRFEAPESTDKFLWKLVPAESN